MVEAIRSESGTAGLAIDVCSPDLLGGLETGIVCVLRIQDIVRIVAENSESRLLWEDCVWG